MKREILFELEYRAKLVDYFQKEIFIELEYRVRQGKGERVAVLSKYQ